MSGGALVVMAAGHGTRYGGSKQTDPIGPSGETLLEYSVFDALRAGFDHVVVVLRRDLEHVFRPTVGARIERRASVSYVFQDDPPSTTQRPPDRSRPWGTGHALLVATTAFSGAFAVINADDYYGRNSFEVLARGLRLPDAEAALVGFRLRDTLSESGSVRRGLCLVGEKGLLRGVKELHGLVPDGEGVTYREHDGTERHLTGDELVSMNMWAFRNNMRSELHTQWSDFLAANSGSEDAEFYIPTAVTALIDTGMRCRVLESESAWFGVTYREDRAKVIERMNRLVSAQLYPHDLWS